MTPYIAGPFHIAGTYNGKTYFSNVDSTRYIIWDGSSKWYIAPTIETPVAAAWEMEQASHIGIYDPINGASEKSVVSLSTEYEFEFSGEMTPDVNGPVVLMGTHNAKPLYIHASGVYYLSWDADDSWYIAPDPASPTAGIYWKCTTADPPGLYAPFGGATGDVTVAIA